MALVLTGHAQVRMAGRGISVRKIEAVLAWGRDVPVGSGASSITLPRDAAAEMVREGFSPKFVDTLRRVAVVVGGGEVVVTAMLLSNSNRSRRRYLRGGR